MTAPPETRAMEAEAAVENAFRFQAKKDAMRQLQTGEWALTFKVLAQDVPVGLLTAAMGARFMVAACAISDDETATEQSPEALETPSEPTTYRQEIGSRGGKARAEALSPERRSEIARKAADTRWGNADETTEPVTEPVAAQDGPEEAAPPPEPGAGPAPRRLEGVSQAQQAGILCGANPFRQFIGEHYAAVQETLWADASLEEARKMDVYGITPPTVRAICRIQSRAEFDTDEGARKRWLELVSDYHAWLDARQRNVEAGQ